MTQQGISAKIPVPGSYRELFGSALLAFVCNEPEKNRQLLTRGSKEALREGRFEYHEFFEAELAFVGNNLADAVKHYDLALNKAPDNPLFLSNKAMTLVIMGKAQEAIPLFEKSLATNPDERHALAGLIVALAEIGKFPRAKELLDTLLKKPNLESIYKFQILGSLVDLDQEKKALRVADELLAEFPNNIYCSEMKLRIESKFEARRQREYRRRPYLRALLTCDSVEIVSGKSHCDGVFDFINMLTFPAVAPKFFVFVSFLSKRLKSTISVSFRNNRGKPIYQLGAKVYTANLRGATQYVVEVRSWTIPAPGSYSIDVRIDGKKIGSTPLVVQKVEPRPDYSAEELQKLLDDPKTLKHARVSFNCGRCNKQYILQMNLDPNAPLGDGVSPFPENDQLTCTECDQPIDTKAMRLQARQVLGTKVKGKEKEAKPT